MFLAKTLSFYKRPEIQEAIAEHAKSKEVAVKFGDRGFGKRPQAISYPNDVMEFAKKRATSFHCSEELWMNPLNLKTEMSRKDQDELRSGWDFIIDIDCGFFEYSKIAAHMVIRALKYCGVKSITCKFSGNKGFHIGVPWEAFPKTLKGEEIRTKFPEAPRRMAEYIGFLIREPVKEEIKKREGKDINVIAENVGVSVEKLKITDTLGGIDLNPDPFIEIDTILISSRHLYRMPYSFHEKSRLVSVPIDPDKVLEFEKSEAEPKKVTATYKFLDRDVEKENAEGLMIRAYDYKPKTVTEEKKKREYEIPEEAIPEECFPPSIKKILAGVGDGRKRAVFVLINFLKCCGWNHDQIEEKLMDWNEKNKEPLREVYIKGQLRHSKNKKPVPPPNYDNNAYYLDIGVQESSQITARFKNPLQYARVMYNTRGKKKKS